MYCVFILFSVLTKADLEQRKEIARQRHQQRMAEKARQEETGSNVICEESSVIINSSDAKSPQYDSEAESSTVVCGKVINGKISSLVFWYYFFTFSFSSVIAINLLYFCLLVTMGCTANLSMCR